MSVATEKLYLQYTQNCQDNCPPFYKLTLLLSVLEVGSGEERHSFKDIL
jgi:hypothetical protein